jgi:hypothetical protein
MCSETDGGDGFLDYAVPVTAMARRAGVDVHYFIKTYVDLDERDLYVGPKLTQEEEMRRVRAFLNANIRPDKV